MRKPTLSKIKQYFKYAEIVADAYTGEKFNMNEYDLESIELGDGATKNDYIIYEKRDRDYDKILFDYSKGYAKILSYKTPQFEITKETILKYNMKDEFPSVFKVELVKNKWYKSLINPKSIIYVIDFIDVQKIRGYGFNTSGSWESDDCRTSWGLPSDGNFRQATAEEIKKALIAEAKKRYKVGDFINCLSNGYTDQKGIVLKDFDYYSVTNDFWGVCESGLCVCLFKNGVWATIIETITREEAEKQLNKKII